VGVCDCEADAGSRKIENSAPPKQGALYLNPGIIAVSATWRSAAIIAPVFAELQSMLVERLAPYPPALAAVIDGLRALEDRSAPAVIEQRAA